MKLRSAALLAAAVALTGCALTRPARDVPESGFLSDYGQLHKGAEGQAELVYIRPGVDWKQYDRMLLDPVTVWRTATGCGVSEHDAQVIADYFDRTGYDAFSRTFRMEHSPQPNTLRVCAASWPRAVDSASTELLRAQASSRAVILGIALSIPFVG